MITIGKGELETKILRLLVEDETGAPLALTGVPVLVLAGSGLQVRELPATTGSSWIDILLAPDALPRGDWTLQIRATFPDGVSEWTATVAVSRGLRLAAG